MTLFLFLFLEFFANAFAQQHAPGIQHDQTQKTSQMTYLLARVLNVPDVVFGSDDKYHLVYEIMLTNIASKKITIDSLHVQNSHGNANILKLTSNNIINRLSHFGSKEKSTVLNAGQSALLYVHAAVEKNENVPKEIVHEFQISLDKNEPKIERIAQTKVNFNKPIVIGPPLKGNRFIAADSCCDSTRHIRAALPIDGSIQIGQRFAIDYEQLDEQGRIYVGSRDDLKSFHIYGKEVLAVANALVVSTENSLPEAKAGAFPQGTTLYNADGNSVVLKIKSNVFAVYAHMQPGSVRVKAGDRVKKGQVIGLVGNSGNSLAPHLHFHIMDGESPLVSNGLPYVIDSFRLTAQASNTHDFDRAEESGEPLPVEKFENVKSLKMKFPMDLNIVGF